MFIHGPQSPLFPAGNWISLCWSQELGIFCAISDTNLSIISNDGITWTDGTLPTSVWTFITWSSRIRCFLCSWNEYFCYFFRWKSLDDGRYFWKLELCLFGHQILVFSVQYPLVEMWQFHQMVYLGLCTPLFLINNGQQLLGVRTSNILWQYPLEQHQWFLQMVKIMDYVIHFRNLEIGFYLLESGMFHFLCNLS